MEIKRFRTYKDKLASGEFLTREEHVDFILLGRKIKQGLTGKERSNFDLALAGLQGFAEGALIRSLLEK